MRFRKKPVEIEAVQWTGDNTDAISQFVGEDLVPMGDEYETPTEVGIFTPEGVMTAHVGDWIIKGVKGEFYPCKPDIFEETYEVAEDTDMTDVRERSMRVTDVHFNPADRSATIRIEGYHRMNISDAIKRGDMLYIFREKDISEIDKGFSHLLHELMEANKNLARYKQCFKDMKELMEGEEND